MNQPLFKLPNSRASEATRECTVHKEQRSIQGGYEIRPSGWIFAEGWQVKLGSLRSRARRKPRK